MTAATPIQRINQSIINFKYATKQHMLFFTAVYNAAEIVIKYISSWRKITQNIANILRHCRINNC